MAKIRLINLRGGKKGWSIPYKFGGVQLRKVAPIEDKGKGMKQSGKEIKAALKDELERTSKI